MERSAPFPDIAAEPRSQAGLSGNDALFLALYLILLAFFILLNTHANPTEKRAAAVLTGFEPQFVTPIAEPTDLSLVKGRLDAELSETLGRHLPEGGWRLVVRDGMLTVSLPMHRAFREGGAVLQPARLSLIRRMSELFGRILADSDADLRIVLSGEVDDLSRRRAGALARDLMRHGLTPDRFRIGVASGSEAVIRFELKGTTS